MSLHDSQQPLIVLKRGDVGESRQRVAATFNDRARKNRRPSGNEKFGQRLT
jgi:hypothetical protein